MDNIDNSSNKTFGVKDGIVKGKFENPIRKCHNLDGKCFIVIDQSIVEKLKSLGIDDTELYFQQELTKNGSLVLYPFKFESI